MARIGTATPKTMAQAGQAIVLRSGEAQVIPGGEWMINSGIYSTLQYYDPVPGIWRNYKTNMADGTKYISSDGSNYRLFNQTGTVVAGIVTNGGTANAAKNGVWPAATSNATTGVTVTTTAGSLAPAGTQLFNAIVGGAISATVTISAGGANYTLPPIVQFGNPAPGGLVATGYAVLTSGAVSSIVVTNQGAGYPSATTVSLVAQAGDIGAGAAATCILDTAQSGKLVAVTLANNAGGYAAVPTLTVAGLAGSPAVTAVMALSVVTAPTVSSASGGANGYQLQSVAGLCAATNTTTNPEYTINMVGIRNAIYAYGTSATFATQVILDGGISQIDSANLGVFSLAATGTTPAATTFASGTSGGQNDASWILPL
jgi:hypothetical protein